MYVGAYWFCFYECSLYSWIEITLETLQLIIMHAEPNINRNAKVWDINLHVHNIFFFLRIKPIFLNGSNLGNLVKFWCIKPVGHVSTLISAVSRASWQIALDPITRTGKSLIGPCGVYPIAPYRTTNLSLPNWADWFSPQSTVDFFIIKLMCCCCCWCFGDLSEFM